MFHGSIIDSDSLSIQGFIDQLLIHGSINYLLIISDSINQSLFQLLISN